MSMSRAVSIAKGVEDAWEYHTCEVDRPLDVEDLDGLGRRGWRLAGIARHDATLHYTFVRTAGRDGHAAGPGARAP
jgi:hypothetical protein